MSLYKLRKIKEYLEEKLSQSFIISSTINFISQILLVEKNDRSLLFVIDYYKFNKTTKKKRYFILLIFKTIAQLQGKRYLIRFKIIIGFNNLRILEDSRETTIFKTYFSIVMGYLVCQSLGQQGIICWNSNTCESEEEVNS